MIISLTEIGGKVVLVNSDYIQEVFEDKSGSAIYFSGDEKPTIVTESLSQVKKLIVGEEVEPVKRKHKK